MRVVAAVFAAAAGFGGGTDFWDKWSDLVSRVRQPIKVCLSETLTLDDSRTPVAEGRGMQSPGQRRDET